MLAGRESRPRSPRRSHRRRPTVNYQQSDDDDYDPHDDDYAPHDDYDPYDDADDHELADLRAKQARNMTKKVREAEATKRYRARHPERVAAVSKRYRARHPDRVAEYHKRYRESHRALVAEQKKRYWENHRERLLARQQRYRENHREQLMEKQRQRHARLRETHAELLREQNRIRRARFREKKRAAKKLKALGPLTLDIPLVREAHPELLREKKRTAEKLNALGPLTLTIPLTDCLKPIRVTAYVIAFCDSLDSEDTNVPPTESFVQLLEEDSRTLLDLDSGAVQVAEPPDCDDLSSLLQSISPDEWAELLKDIEESSSFDLEALMPPQGINDWLEDMTSSDEGVDLMYDLVS